MRVFLIIPITLLVVTTVWARGVYQEPEQFIQETFSNNPPPTKIFWLTRDIRATVKNILGHKLNVLRIRYWDDNNRTAWILEEIGKDKPITTGIVIKQGKIERIKVLIFRESRGWEVRYPFFTDQFAGLSLQTDKSLSRYIDGISGATLSVRALKKLARLALYLDQKARESHDAP